MEMRGHQRDESANLDDREGKRNNAWTGASPLNFFRNEMSSTTRSVKSKTRNYVVTGGLECEFRFHRWHLEKTFHVDRAKGVSCGYEAFWDTMLPNNTIDSVLVGSDFGQKIGDPPLRPSETGDRAERENEIYAARMLNLRCRGIKRPTS